MGEHARAEGGDGVQNGKRPDGSTAPAASDLVINQPNSDPTMDVFSFAELGQRLAELEVRLDVAESERWHARAVLASLCVPVIVTDPFEDVILLSTAAAELLGVDSTPGGGGRGYGPLASMWPDEAFVAAVAEVKSIHRRGARRTVRQVVSTEDGEITFDITLVCVCDQSDGRPSPWGVVAVLREVSAERTGSQIERAKIESELAGAIYQQLQSPLDEMHTAIDRLSRAVSSDDPDHRAAISTAVAELTRLSRLAQDLEAWSQLGQTLKSARMDDTFSDQVTSKQT